MADSSDRTAFPTHGRLLGLDYGSKRIGLAVSNADQTISSPVENYTRRDEPQDARYLKRMAEEYRIVGIVVGLPVHMSGQEGEKARSAREFGEWAATATTLPICFWDERFTSAMAEEQLQEAGLTKKQRKARLDMLAAQIMLQTYLESTSRELPPGSMTDS